MYNKQPASVSTNSTDCVSMMNPYFFVGGELSWLDSPSAGHSWTTADMGFAHPFYIWDPVTICKLGWMNAGTTTHSVDCGIYNASWSLLVNTGSTTRTGTNVWQWVDVPDTALTGGGTLYYLAFTEHSTGSEVFGWNTSQFGRQAMGHLIGYKQMTSCWQTSPAGLPSTFSPEDYNGGKVQQLCAFTIRSQVT